VLMVLFMIWMGFRGKNWYHAAFAGIWSRCWRANTVARADFLAGIGVNMDVAERDAPAINLTPCRACGSLFSREVVRCCLKTSGLSDRFAEKGPLLDIR